MSTRLTVLRALIDLMKDAVPGARVVGLSEEEDLPTRVGDEGIIVVRAGDPGDPEIDLSPLSYNWTHRIPVEVVMADEDALDAALVAIGEMIEANRQLGGLCDWLESDAPATQNIIADDAEAQRGAPLTITAIYVTSNPLT